MADTASLITRVKTDGAQQASKQLDDLATSANTADTAVNKLTPDVGKLDKASATAAKGGLSGLRNGAQQVGFQMQDMIVQIQGGTSAFVAIGQQASQLAGAFGPGGAVLGAVIALASAVGGALYKSLTEASGSAEDLKNAQNQLKAVFQETNSGALELTDGMIQLTATNAAAAETMLVLAEANAKLIMAKSAEAIKKDAESWESWRASTSAAISQYDALKASGRDVEGTLNSLSGTYEGNIVGVNMLAQNIELMGEQLGASKQQAIAMIAAQSEFNKQPTAENARRIADQYTAILNSSKNVTPELINLTKSANDNATAMENAAKSVDANTAAQNRNGAAINSTTQKMQAQNAQIVRNLQISILADRDRVAAQAQADKEAFAKREGVTKDQIDAYNKARDEEARQDIARIDKTEKEKNDRIAEAAARKEEAQAKREANEAERNRKAGQDFLNTLARQNQDELAAIDAQQEQKLKRAEELRASGAITAQQEEDAKTQIMLDADAKRNELLQKQTEERQKKQNSADSFIEQLQAQNEGELAEIDRQNAVKMEKLQQFYNDGLIAEEDFQRAKADIEQMYDKARIKQYGNVLNQTTDDLKTALGEGNKAYKAFAIANAIMQTYQGAVAAFQSAAAIPLVGWIAAPVAAAAAVAAGMANVAKIRSAREQGGNLAAGQISTIAERGKPEVIMPAGASRVRTAEQMRQIMGENGGSRSGGDSVTIVNNTTGRIDQATTERDDEGRLRVIISETVASAFQDSNSDISKSRRSSRGLPGFG